MIDFLKSSYSVQIKQRRRAGVWLLMILLLSGCAASVTVPVEAPQPLVDRLPLTAKLVLSDEFKDFAYEEDEEKRSVKRLSMGAAQTAVFENVFGGVFQLTNSESADLTITPEVLSLQYSAPRETQLNLYEVFLRYRVQIEDAKKRKVADWVLKGYGKTPTAQFTSAERAFELATLTALRDVGAQIAIGLPLQKSIKQLVADKSPAASEVGSSTESD